jgi:hypothetical protein
VFQEHGAGSTWKRLDFLFFVFFFFIFIFCHFLFSAAEAAAGIEIPLELLRLGSVCSARLRRHAIPVAVTLTVKVLQMSRSSDIVDADSSVTRVEDVHPECNAGGCAVPKRKDAPSWRGEQDRQVQYKTCLSPVSSQEVS